MGYYSFNRPRGDGRLSWPCWLTDSGRLTHKVVTRPAISLPQDRESSPAWTGVLTTMLRHQLHATVTGQQDGAPSHRSIYRLAILQTNVPDFTERSNRTSNSYDLNPWIIQFGGALQQLVCPQKFKNIDRLKRVLKIWYADCWDMINQKLTRRRSWECISPPSKFLKTARFGKNCGCHVRTVPGNTCVKFEVRSFNRFGAISI